MPTSAELTINASPTKDFFISMLTRDIPLTRAIIDLVDNSVDGARRLRTQTAGGNRFDGLSVRLECRSDSFKISDNCGGMTVEHARDYAFRFGRPEGAVATPNSVGQFGVGMKRALFKMGRTFEVSSRATTSQFIVRIDVDEWRVKRDPDGKDIWEFEFAELQTELEPTEEPHTTITITNLNDAVSKEFANPQFLKQLKLELEGAQKTVLDNGLAMTLNGMPLDHDPLQLLSSEYLQPASPKFNYFEDTDHPVHVQLYAGLSKDENTEMGWYVFCNGRSVLEADTTFLTGWGEGIPNAHYQFKLFRGFAYFDCDDASKLPWNTTKTGIDVDSPLYKAVRQKMIGTMRPVIDFLNDFEKERKSDDEQKPLLMAISTANSIQILNLPTNEVFASSKPPEVTTPTPTEKRITYSRPTAQVKRVMDALGISTSKAAGEMTFDYYVETELD
jgi:hypothetical protein